MGDYRGARVIRVFGDQLDRREKPSRHIVLNHRDCNKRISKDPSHRPALKTELREPRPMIEFGKKHKATLANKAGLDLILEFGLNNGRS